MGHNDVEVPCQALIRRVLASFLASFLAPASAKRCDPADPYSVGTWMGDITVASDVENKRLVMRSVLPVSWRASMSARVDGMRVFARLRPKSHSIQL